MANFEQAVKWLLDGKRVYPNSKALHYFKLDDENKVIIYNMEIRKPLEDQGIYLSDIESKSWKVLENKNEKN